MSSKEPIRVLLVDHDGVVRWGFRVIIDNAPGMVAVGETASVDDAVTLADEVRPDVVLFEINVARRGFDDLIGKLRARSGDLCQVIVLTSRDDDEALHLSLRAARADFCSRMCGRTISSMPFTPSPAAARSSPRR